MQKKNPHRSFLLKMIYGGQYSELSINLAVWEVWETLNSSIGVRSKNLLALRFGKSIAVTQVFIPMRTFYFRKPGRHNNSHKPNMVFRQSSREIIQMGRYIRVLPKQASTNWCDSALSPSES